MTGYVWLAAAIVFVIAAIIQTASALIGREALLFIPVPLQVLAAGMNGFVAYLHFTA